MGAFEAGDHGLDELQQFGLVDVAGGLAREEVVFEHAQEGEVQAPGVEQRLQLELNKGARWAGEGGAKTRAVVVVGRYLEDGEDAGER